MLEEIFSLKEKKLSNVLQPATPPHSRLTRLITIGGQLQTAGYCRHIEHSQHLVSIDNTKAIVASTHEVVHGIFWFDLADLNEPLGEGGHDMLHEVVA